MVENSCKVNPIGGYFELADREPADNFPHENGILLNTGRNALEYILRSIKSKKLIYLPYFTCEVVLEPIKKLNLPYRFYHINDRFEIADNIVLGEGEYIIVNNYYGIKDLYIRSLYTKFGDRLIVDCAQALFAPVIPGSKAFYSPRKFVGVADGGIAYLGDEVGEDISSYDVDPTEDHNDHLLIRKVQGAEAGFKNYLNNERALGNQQICRMSFTTKDALLNIDYEKVKARRIANWNLLNDELFTTNKLKIPHTSDFKCPMVYPYVVDNGLEIRKKLISEKIFVAKYWPNVDEWTKSDMVENWMANHILPLPIDQRYNEEDMKKIIKILQKY